MDLRSAAHRVCRRELLEARQSAFDRREEALLLDARRVDDVLRPLIELRIYPAHRLDNGFNAEDERRLLAAEEPRVTHRAPQNPPKHVASALVRRKDSVGEQERDS